jgi:transposase
MWLQYDWGVGPVIAFHPANLFWAWLAWSRYRVVLPTWDKTLGSVLACVDNTLRRAGGAPTYLLTDNERTLTTDRVAGVPVRHPNSARGLGNLRSTVRSHIRNRSRPG